MATVNFSVVKCVGFLKNARPRILEQCVYVYVFCCLSGYGLDHYILDRGMVHDEISSHSPKDSFLE